AYRFRAPQGFAAPGSRPPLPRQTTHSKFKRGKKAKAGDALVIRTSPYTESHLPM
ncbi:hypothetical protein P3T43_006567, partial [Paraburkholderia sp. GAS41]